MTVSQRHPRVYWGLGGGQEKESQADWVKALELGGTNTWHIAPYPMLQTPQIGNYTLFSKLST